MPDNCSNYLYLELLLKAIILYLELSLFVTLNLLTVCKQMIII